MGESPQELQPACLLACLTSCTGSVAFLAALCPYASGHVYVASCCGCRLPFDSGRIGVKFPALSDKMIANDRRLTCETSRPHNLPMQSQATPTKLFSPSHDKPVDQESRTPTVFAAKSVATACHAFPLLEEIRAFMALSCPEVCAAGAPHCLYKDAPRYDGRSRLQFGN